MRQVGIDRNVPWILGRLVFWLTSRNGYKLVLAPEGTPSISVNYWALAGPALLWLGAGLFAWRRRDRRDLRLGSTLVRSSEWGRGSIQLHRRPQHGSRNARFGPKTPCTLRFRCRG